MKAVELTELFRMRPERRGGTERTSFGSSSNKVLTPLRDRNDCLNTPPTKGSGAKVNKKSPRFLGSSKIPGSSDHPSVLDRRATNLVSARLAAVSDEKQTPIRARNQLRGQTRQENGDTTPSRKGVSVLDEGQCKRALRTQGKGQQDKTDGPRLKSKHDISVSPARKSARIRQKMSMVNTSKQEANASTTRDTLMKSTCVVDQTEQESAARPIGVNIRQKRLVNVMEENKQEEDIMTEGVSTRELASGARKKFCHLDGQYTTDGRKVRMASSRFNRRKPQRKPSLRISQRKVSLRRPCRKVSIRGCKSLVKNIDAVKEGKVLSSDNNYASHVETGSPESVDHTDRYEKKPCIDDISAPSILEDSSCRRISSTEERQSLGQKRILEVKLSPDEVCSHKLNLLSTQSGNVSSAKKTKLDGKCDLELVGHSQPALTHSSVRTSRIVRLAGSSSGMTTTLVQKVKVSGQTNEFTINKVKKIRLDGPTSELTNTPVHKVKVSEPASELTTTPVQKAKVSGRTSELTNISVQKVKVSGPALTTGTTPIQTPARTPMHVHFSGLKDEPLTQCVRRKPQNKSAAVASIAKTSSTTGPDSAGTDAACLEDTPGQVNTSEECQIR